ncbi:response regulator [Dactylosporangium sp. NPDC049742]|uniref:response regulator n=1 Tax=Dactylosporangium sp. NPDC049742 TaxID=3154737 RepID=UPI00343A06DE
MALIVVADDNADVRSMIALVLQRAGHIVVAVDDGVQALIETRARRPGLVLTDGSMPRMTGAELCRELAADPDTAEIPVMMISGSVDPADLHQHLPFLAAVMAKPFEPNDLIRRVNFLLEGQ